MAGRRSGRCPGSCVEFESSRCGSLSLSLSLSFSPFLSSACSVVVEVRLRFLRSSDRFTRSQYVSARGSLIRSFNNALI